MIKRLPTQFEIEQMRKAERLKLVVDSISVIALLVIVILTIG